MRAWRIMASAILAATLAGCAGTAPLDRDGVPGLAVVSRTLAGSDYVEIEVLHRSLHHRVEQVALVAPDGTRFPSRDMRTKSVRQSYYPGSSIGISGGSGGHIGVGVGFLFPLNGLFRNPAYRTRALVRVPDKDSYRRRNKDWKIAVVMGTRHGKPRTILRPAPAPR
jgi:hypothetical protein